MISCEMINIRFRNIRHVFQTGRQLSSFKHRNT